MDIEKEIKEIKERNQKVELNKIFDVIRSVHSYECFEFAIYDISSINK